MLARRHRPAVQLTIDGVCWAAGLLLAMVIRYDFAAGWHQLWSVAEVLPLVILAHLSLGLGIGLYQGLWRFGSFEEVAALALTASISGVLLSLLDVTYLDHVVPASVPLGAAVFALVGMMGSRYVWRLLTERNHRPAGTAEPLVVLGAGNGAAQIVSSLLLDPTSPYRPVALLDDDPRKANLRIRGIPVVGRLDALVEVATRLQARTVLLAIPSATAELVRDLTARCVAADLQLRVVPTVPELVGHRLGTADIRKVTPADLLGRREIDTNLAEIGDYLAGKRVLVTGAGGSIGSVLCRHLVEFAPAELVMLDRDESALHGLQLSIEGRALLDSPNLVVADIRDRQRLREIFATWKPQVVFHAAALKHLTLLEQHVDEAIKTNVFGTQNVIDAALEFGVERFVNISTDKAADPCSVLGLSKRVAERLTARAALEGSGAFLSVRFGNVLGSRGSMLDTFQAQIAAGGPVTVTDRDVTRFFMTIDEAVQLVVQAGAIGRSGEALVLDMGSPVRIADVARQLVALADVPVDIVYTGLRPGEKLHEVLLGAGELDDRHSHPLISHVQVPPLPRDGLVELADAIGRSWSRAALTTACEPSMVDVIDLTDAALERQSA